MRAPLSVGQTVSMAGFFTHALYLRSQAGEEIERRLGYRKGRLSSGWWLLFLQQMPAPDQFEYRGYSQMSGGRAQGHVRSDTPTAEESLLRSGVKVFSLKSRTLKETFFLSGPGRLAKVVPVAEAFGELDYPPGSGIPQFELTAPLPFRVVAHVGPGETYLGDYV
ncbi:MAG: hypothetical protein H7Y08_05390 [Rhizobiaceae bacterium]|nr:hypothetical protein [Rhizobiaceae bacterium]